MIESDDWRVAAAALAGAVLVLATPLASAAGSALEVDVTGLRSAKGRVACTLYDGPRGFPVDPRAAVQQRWCAVNATTSTSKCAFDPVPPGTYAIACFHDENDNGTLDRGLFGIPKEGVVASNHAKGTFGPPKFDDAKFAVSAAGPRSLALRIGY